MLSAELSTDDKLLGGRGEGRGCAGRGLAAACPMAWGIAFDAEIRG